MSMNARSGLVAALLLGLLVSCEPDPASVVVAEVNDQIITLAQVEESLAGLGEEAGIGCQRLSEHRGSAQIVGQGLYHELADERLLQIR